MCAIIFACLFQGYDMKIKEGVRITGLKPEIVLAATIVDSVYRKYGRELVITSGVEGSHSKTSRHYLGYAIDCRTRFFLENQIPQVHREIVAALGDDYYVEFEGNHFHVQFSPEVLIP